MEAHAGDGQSWTPGQFGTRERTFRRYTGSIRGRRHRSLTRGDTVVSYRSLRAASCEAQEKKAKADTVAFSSTNRYNCILTFHKEE